MTSTKDKREIICDTKGCRKVIGHIGIVSGRPTYYGGTAQVGFNSYCSKKHFSKEWKWDEKNRVFQKTAND